MSLILSILQVVGGLGLLIIPGLVYSYIFFPRVGLVARSALAATISLVLIPTVMFYANLLGVAINIVSVVLVILLLITVGLAYLLLNHFKNKKKDENSSNK
ncbi:MAG: hypothetical protein HQ530_00580 [Parcubacteria group bacterium]|nr:hypothetical protein [Parcubacteria group bacterium]